MADKKIIAVTGATGAQAGGLARAILDDPSGEFALRAVTRDPGKDAARALADRFNIPPIGPPVVLNPISLSATVAGGIANRVMLTWSGATTNTVDIYRNGTKLTTTANDGTFLDLMVAAGTYQYRVCNLGSTVCSADVQVVVS